jgi:uncharacterized protein (TIGR03503 family)
VHELQILIDVSGSMKQNDPYNLRIPAVKLLVNLLPKGTKAGLWLFAEKTSVLVETGIVDAQWKKKALARISKIHYRGLFTNIEDAIQTSAQDWFKSDAQHKRILILLTDGMVDISKDIMQSAESRERIIVEQIPLLQQAGVKVQTIALSDNADKQLLEKLAFDTNGWSETTQNAEQLQKVFFKMFKKAVPQDTVPIRGNVFSIDTAIKEFSLLIFKQSGASASQLIAPDKTTISSVSHPENVAWLNEKNYDLVTIKGPKVGVWKIDAQVDPDNQVMIVTDLKFKVDEIANHISAKESFKLTSYFTDQQQLISREDFLKLIEITVELVDEQGKKDQWIMQPVEGKAGLFSYKVKPLNKTGKYTITMIADAKTFKRESIQTIDVIEGSVGVETEINKVDRTITLKIIADEGIIDSQMMSVQVTIDQPGQASETHTLEKKSGNWQIIIEAPEQGKRKIINFSIMAKTKQGDSISPNIKPIVINDSLFAAPEPVEEKKKEEIVAENVENKPLEIVEEPVEVKDEVNWMKTSIIVVVVNIILIAGCFFTFKFMKKRTADKQTQLLNRLT